MAYVLKDSFIDADDTYDNIYGAEWKAQTFTAGSAYAISKAALKLYLGTGSPGTVTVSVKAVDGAHKPTGADLASGTSNGNDFGGAPGAFIDFIYSVTANLSNGVEYALVCRAPSGDGSNYIRWRVDTEGGYAGGQAWQSGDSGATWSSAGAYDAVFNTYRDEAPSASPSASPSQSPSASPSQSPSASASPSASPSKSPSSSPSQSPSASASPSSSPSQSPSASKSPSASPSASPSSSPSASPSESPSPSIAIDDKNESDFSQAVQDDSTLGQDNKSSSTLTSDVPNH